MKKLPLLSKYFAFLERRSGSDRLLFHLALVIFATSLFYLGLQFNTAHTALVPTAGGTLVEGIVGTPRFINPVLAITQADLDTTALIYSGLMKLNPEGDLVPDLAESVTISEDGRTYHIKLKTNRYFSNGTRVSAKDVAYTIALIQNPELKSPLRDNWENVTVQEQNEYELSITMKDAYTPFLENLTVGIIPHNLWNRLPIEQIPFSQHNTEPIGSGPYYVTEVTHNTFGLIDSYTLKGSPYAETKPKISTFILRFYQNPNDIMTALKKGDITSTAALDADHLADFDLKSYNTYEIPLPRLFALFFNQNKSSVLRDPAVRSALSVAVDRNKLVQEVLHGHGIPTDGPIPFGFSTLESTSTVTNSTATDPSAKARALLAAGNWIEGDDGLWRKKIDGAETPLSLTISTGNTPFFDQTVNQIAASWRAAGVEVNVDEYEQNDLTQTIIRPRNFQVLLFGNVVRRPLDLYPFWHSSRKDDPGLNVSQYTNIDTDALLSAIRIATSTTARDEKIRAFTDIIAEEKPAVFLFSPTFTYITNPDLTIVTLKRLGNPSDRFANVSDWYIDHQRLWPIFTPD